MQYDWETSWTLSANGKLFWLVGRAGLALKRAGGRALCNGTRLDTLVSPNRRGSARAGDKTNRANKGSGPRPLLFRRVVNGSTSFRVDARRKATIQGSIYKRRKECRIPVGEDKSEHRAIWHNVSYSCPDAARLALEIAK